MKREIHTVVLRRGLWEVRYGSRRDPDLTTVVRQAIGEKAPETQRKAARFIARFLNFRLRRNEAHDAFITEPVMIGRVRIEALLRSSGFEIVYETNRIDGSCYVRGKKRSVSELPVWLAAISRLYAALHRNLLRGPSNPMKVDGWHKLLPIEKLELARNQLGSTAKLNQYRGSQYISSGAAPSPLRIEDPIALGPKVLKAGREFGWPPAIYDLVTVMSVDGPRWADTSPLTAADWARSKFGRTLWAPNKTSKGVRVKNIVVTAACVAQIRRSFDADPSRPNMSELEELLSQHRWDALERIHLFPGKRGVPHSYHVFNNDYLRPAVEAAGLMIHGKIGSVRPTAHRLRAARIQEEVDHIFRPGRTEEQIDADLDQLQKDVFIRNTKAFERYVGEKREERALVAQIKRFDERQNRIAAAQAAGEKPASQRHRSKSRAQERLGNYA